MSTIKILTFIAATVTVAGCSSQGPTEEKSSDDVVENHGDPTGASPVTEIAKCKNGMKVSGQWVSINDTEFANGVSKWGKFAYTFSGGNTKVTNVEIVREEATYQVTGTLQGDENRYVLFQWKEGDTSFVYQDTDCMARPVTCKTDVQGRYLTSRGGTLTPAAEVEVSQRTLRPLATSQWDDAHFNRWQRACFFDGTVYDLAKGTVPGAPPFNANQD